MDEDWLFEVYSSSGTPVLIIGVCLFVTLATLAVLRFFGRREESGKGFFSRMFERQRVVNGRVKGDDAEKPPAVEKQLEGKEDVLKKREDELKSRKRVELSDRERVLRKRELEERVQKERRLREREVSLLRQAHTGRVSRHEWVRPSGVGFDFARGYVKSPHHVFAGSDDYLVKEKDRLRGLIDSAVGRFHRGELDDAVFSKMVLDYQRQLIEVEIQMRGSAY